MDFGADFAWSSSSIQPEKGSDSGDQKVCLLGDLVAPEKVAKAG